MQPLSRVNVHATSVWGTLAKLESRPQAAIKVAECIAAWSTVEVSLATFLGFLMHNSQKASLAMFTSVENRAAQLRLVEGAAKQILSPTHYDVISVLLTAIIRPVMKERDKLAHWCWGVSDKLPNDLLIMRPSDLIDGYVAQALAATRRNPDPILTGRILEKLPEIYVVTPDDLNRLLGRITKAEKSVRIATGSVWNKGSKKERAECLQLLSSEPEIQAGLARLASGRQKNQATQPPSPPPDQNGEA
jgi:hypothetical protein